MKLRKLWIFLCGLCAIFVFYLTVATVVVYIILDRIEAETGSSAGLFDNWYQTLLFVLDIVFALGAAAFVVLTVLWGKKNKKQKNAEPTSAAHDSETEEEARAVEGV